ncbi:MAG TPA: TetR/AcrR family transcriptional regulator [Actinocrinis sp.]|nr:TetR/AcrR family transcriptional regulator [Actinocrinis sp.]
MPPPALGDHEARRLAVSEAVWRVLAARGFGGLRLRAVAAEMGASTGLLTHYFPTKRALLVYALDLLEQRNQSRTRKAEPTDGSPPPPACLATLRQLVLDGLPVDEDSIAANRIWVGSWDVALADPEFGAEHDRRYARSREKLRTHIEAAQRLGELPAASSAQDLAAGVQSFYLGLVVQTLLAPPEFPPARQIALVDAYLAALAIGSAGESVGDCGR